MIRIVQLTASSFLGGPERQMVELAAHLPPDFATVFASFSENGRCQPFFDAIRAGGFPTVMLKHDRPRVWAATREIVQLLREHRADLLCTHGYKADLLGLPAARWVGIPIVAVSRGWTGAGRRARVYEALDRLALRWMDCVVGVSEAQRTKVLAAGVPQAKTCVIHNAIRPERLAKPAGACRDSLQSLFHKPRSVIVGAAGRLSPEKGFEILVQAAPTVVARCPDVGFVLCGEGWMRDTLAAQIDARGLQRHFVLAGFRSDLDDLLPGLDLMVLPSYTEGLPNVVLEAMAAGVPVVATAVGGTPEVIEDGLHGYLVPPGDAQALAARIQEMISNPRRAELGRLGCQRVTERFSFSGQARAYEQLFRSLAGSTAALVGESESARSGPGLEPAAGAPASEHSLVRRFNA